ncbi:hypothetical protein ABCR94_18590 [Streptomyces sp. 21So2-11]|uniref:hypothetical protein n=1 Tax=Streptomyces sp. 21So2-11 TaxID=3144408 RepID=UPI00321A68CA
MYNIEPVGLFPNAAETVIGSSFPQLCFIPNDLEASVMPDRRASFLTRTVLQEKTNRGYSNMKRAISTLLSATLLGGALFVGVGTASADTGPRTAAVSAAPPIAMVDPIGEQRSMCTVYKSKNACKSLLMTKKMKKAVKDCLVKAGIGGAAALIVGRFVSKDLASDIAKKTIVAGSAGCLAALA